MFRKRSASFAVTRAGLVRQAAAQSHLMKTTLRLTLAFSCLLAPPLFAGPVTEVSAADNSETSASSVSFPFEFEAEYSYIGDSAVSRSFRNVRDFDENYFSLRFV